MKTWIYVMLFVCVGCVADEGDDASTAPTITTGETIDGLSSHWAANPCIGLSVKVGFAEDGTGVQHPGFGARQEFTWTRTSETTVTLSYEETCTVCLGSITEMTGGVEDGQLVGKGFRSDGYSPNTCEFALVGGGVP